MSDQGYSDQQLGSLRFYDDKGKPVDITPQQQPPAPLVAPVQQPK